MKLKIAAIFAILLTALMLLAQDTAQIFSEIAPSGRESEESSVSTVSAPVATPAIEPIAAPVVMPAEPARPSPAVVEVAPVAAVPVVVEAAPAAVTPAVAPVVTPAAPAVVEATPAAATAGAAPEDVVETVIVSAEPATGGTIKAGLISVSLKENAALVTSLKPRVGVNHSLFYLNLPKGASRDSRRYMFRGDSIGFHDPSTFLPTKLRSPFSSSHPLASNSWRTDNANLSELILDLAPQKAERVCSR